MNIQKITGKNISKNNQHRKSGSTSTAFVLGLHELQPTNTSTCSLVTSVHQGNDGCQVCSRASLGAPKGPINRHRRLLATSTVCDAICHTICHHMGRRREHARPRLLGPVKDMSHRPSPTALWAHAWRCRPPPKKTSDSLARRMPDFLQVK